MIYTSFLQLRHYLKTHKEWVNICKTPSKLEELLIAYTEGETKKGVILKLCKILQQQSNNNNLDVKEKWELEANIIITDEQWEETFKAGHKVTNSPTWREFDWKIKMRYFITPHSSSPQGTVILLRCVGEVVDWWGTLLIDLGIAERF